MSLGEIDCHLLQTIGICYLLPTYAAQQQTPQLHREEAWNLTCSKYSTYWIIRERRIIRRYVFNCAHLCFQGKQMSRLR